eukprot:TRINITY_DN3001_c0_g1_i1.p1 TRINITY_DN3001_c0_g1~~TRINITY_DN3001_c0_g1_i1.p1  ORF type:complete len:502 (+),score=94.57 TRINITY_DN3001_c0_g1_i1:111-1616(+)
MLQIPTIDPLKFANESVVVIVMIFVVVLLWRYRENVMLALTGDTHVHGGPLDCIWATVRCCGLVNGEWLRLCTNVKCGGRYICPESIRGMNCIKSLGRILGLANHQVEIKNITVGDLPFSRRGDFYLTIECANNPDQVTSLAEGCDPKVVHFPEVLTLRMRWNWLESRVIFKVRELNVLGSTDLCVLSLPAMSVVDWHNLGDSDRRMKRFEMKPCNEDYELETPPWILVEFDKPSEARHLDQVAGIDTVRTATYDPSSEATKMEEVPLIDFKRKYQLQDVTGSVVQEPEEADLTRIRCLRTTVVVIFHLINLTMFSCIVSFCAARFYMWSCYTQYEHLTMAQLNNATFPISLYQLGKLVDECESEVKGTGVRDGIPCRPSEAQIEHVCRNPPKAQPAVGAGRMLAHKTFGWDVKGAHCYVPNATTVHPYFALLDQDVCQWRNEVHPWDFHIFSGIFLAMLSTFCLRACGNTCIRTHKAALQRRQAQRQDQVRKRLEEEGKL